MSSKKICVEEDQQISDDSDKNQEKVVINSLDYDSLAKIIMLLPIPERIDMERVCTKWKEACQLAWYDIKKYKCESSIGRCYDNRLLTQSYLEKILLRCGKYLRELSLSKAFTRSIIPFIGDHCKNLTTLKCKFDINWLHYHPNDFVQAFTQLDKLKCFEITMDHICLYAKMQLSAIINCLPKEINEIHLFSKPLCKQKISMTLQRFRNLKKLTSVGFSLDNIIIQEIAEITTLVYLSIEIYDIPRLFLFNKLVNLEYINSTVDTNYPGFVEKLSTEILNTILCTCKNLKHLDIPVPGSYDVNKIPLEKWINFQNLQHLGICCAIMPDLANTIVKYCKNLKYLRIKKNMIYYTSLKKLTELENLECLILTDDAELHEESITAISNNCKKLKHLEIPDCIIKPAIGDEPLSSPSVLDELSKLQYLEYLNLSYAKNLKDSTIIALANNCKNLKSLNIRGCRAITETALVALTNLENLEKLDVSFLDIITDSFIIKLKGLKELHCEGCENLTNGHIIQIIKNNPDLEFLDVRSLPHISMEIVVAANLATENRTNGIILHLKTSYLPKIRTVKEMTKSQWLNRSIDNC